VASVESSIKLDVVSSGGGMSIMLVLLKSRVLLISEEDNAEGGSVNPAEDKLAGSEE
jgi:hypothetical protein